MSDDPSTSNLNLDVSASAKIEIKTEIPAESTGNLINSLTDLIRPLTEWSGFKADQIRLQRLETLIEIALRSREIKKIEQTPIVPISTKFLVPFLEQASREDIESDLVDWWARLLATASSHKDKQQPIYSHILSSLTSAQAEFASKLWCATDGNSYVSENRSLVSSIVAKRLEKVAKDALKMDKATSDDGVFGNYFAEKLPMICSDLSHCGLFLEYVILPASQESISFETLGAASDEDALVMLGIYKREIVTVAVPSPWIGEFRCEVSLSLFTMMGVNLMRICHGTSDNK